MAVLEHRGRTRVPDSERECAFVLRMELPDDDDSAEALRAAALAAVEAYLEAMSKDQWNQKTSILSRDARPERGKQGPYHMPVKERPPRPKFKARTDVELPQSTLKACHRLVDAVFLASVHGRAVTTGDIVKSRKIAARTLYKLIDPDGPAWSYLEPYLHVYESGSKRVVDLTEEGRLLASQVRAGAVPV